MSVDTGKFEEVVMRIRAASPTLYEQLVIELRRMADGHTLNLVENNGIYTGDPATVARGLGYARAHRDIAKAVAEAPERTRRKEELRHGRDADRQSGPQNNLAAGYS